MLTSPSRSLAQSTQRNAFVRGFPYGAGARKRHAGTKPVGNMALTHLAADAASERGLTASHVNGLAESGECFTFAESRHGDAYKVVYSTTINKVCEQSNKLLCMQTLGEAVKELREERGWSQSELARRVTRAGHKVAPPNIQQLEAGDVAQPRYLPSLAAVFGMTTDDLLAYRHLTVEARKDRPAAQAVPDLRPISVWDSADDLPEGAFVELPRISLRLSGGPGGPDPNAAERLDVGQAFRAGFVKRMGWKPSTHYSMICEGRSMEPTISDRAPVVVDTSQKSIKSGQIYAVLIDGEPRIKRLDKMPGGMVRVRSDNTSSREFDPFDVKADDLEVLGRAVWTASLL